MSGCMAQMSGKAPMRRSMPFLYTSRLIQMIRTGVESLSASPSDNETRYIVLTAFVNVRGLPRIRTKA